VLIGGSALVVTSSSPGGEIAGSVNATVLPQGDGVRDPEGVLTRLPEGVLFEEERPRLLIAALPLSSSLAPKFKLFFGISDALRIPKPLRARYTKVRVLNDMVLLVWLAPSAYNSTSIAVVCVFLPLSMYNVEVEVAADPTQSTISSLKQ